MKKIMVFILIAFLLIPSVAVFSAERTAPTNHAIRIAFDPSLPPYQFYEDGMYQGFFIDLINRIAKEGLIDIELIPMSRNESLEKFKSNDIDIIMGIRYFYDLEDIMNVSDSLVNSTVSITMLSEKTDKIKNILNIEPIVIAVERDSVEFEFVKNIKKANYNLAFNQESVIELLLMGRADMMIGVRHVAEYILDKNNLTDKYTINNSYETPVDYYLGVGKDNVGLLNIINAELRKLKINGEYEKIYNKWINDKNIENQKRIDRNFRIMAVVVAAALFVLLTAGAVNVQLQRRIDQKTKELSTANTKLEKKILEIRNSNELKNFMCESSPRGIVIFDNEGKISVMNERSMEICDLSEAPIGGSVYTLSPVNIMLENNVERVLNHGESYTCKEMTYNAANRQWIFRYVIYPLNDYEKKTRGAIITIEDITDEKLLKEQAAEKEKNRALVQIISGIAHEIRNPLTSIKTYVELLPRKKDNEEFQKQIARVVPHEVERVNKLIENLIDYVKPRIRNEERAKVADVIESCVLLFKPVVNSKNIDLNTNVDLSLYAVIDKNQIKQVIINLMLNAIDAVTEMRNYSDLRDAFEITVSAAYVDGKICLSVADNGIGMTPDELKNVFELFYTTKVKGSGIGLSLSKQIVEDNHGEILIESVKYQGTKFSIFLKGDANAYEKENPDH